MDLLSSSDSSDEVDDDNDVNETSSKRRRRAGKVTLVSQQDDDAGATTEQLLVRSQPHVRGNWAGHVYINMSSASLSTIRDDLIPDLVAQLEAQNYNGPLLVHDHLHISLHRHPFYLQLASIEPFVKALQAQFQYESAGVVATDCASQSVLQLTNASHTRTFFAVPVQASATLQRFHAHVTTILSRYQVSNGQEQALVDKTPFLYHVSLASIPVSAPDQAPVPRVAIKVPSVAIKVARIQVRFGTIKYYQIDLKE